MEYSAEEIFKNALIIGGMFAIFVCLYLVYIFLKDKERKKAKLKIDTMGVINKINYPNKKKLLQKQ
ncbi:hypothetical protein A4G20_04180 [Pasteurellaceae bacterium RH1A]|nr:hypothetical protein A4G20_04180 [Pasteurellaceae bacterium RH1A]